MRKNSIIDPEWLEHWRVVSFLRHWRGTCWGGEVGEVAAADVIQEL